MERGISKFIGAVEMSHVLIRVAVIWVYKFMKTHRTIYLKYMHFILHKLCLNKNKDIKMNKVLLLLYYYGECPTQEGKGTVYRYFSMSINLVYALKILNGLSIKEEKQKEAMEGNPFSD